MFDDGANLDLRIIDVIDVNSNLDGPIFWANNLDATEPYQNDYCEPQMNSSSCVAWLEEEIPEFQKFVMDL